MLEVHGVTPWCLDAGKDLFRGGARRGRLRGRSRGQHRRGQRGRGGGRTAGCGGEGEPRPGDHRRQQQWLPLAERPDHDQSRARRHQKSGPELRSAHRHRPRGGRGGNRPQRDGGLLLVGELALTGAVRPVRGALPIALAVRKQGKRRLFVPEANAREAAMVEGIDVYGVRNLREVVEFLRGGPKAPGLAAGARGRPPAFRRRTGPARPISRRSKGSRTSSAPSRSPWRARTTSS